MRSSLEIARESYSFTCKRCGDTWSGEFEVRRHQDSEGDVEEFWTHRGVPCPSPYKGGCCPGCGGYRIALLPTKRDVITEQRLAGPMAGTAVPVPD